MEQFLSDVKNMFRKEVPMAEMEGAAEIFISV